MPLDIHGRRDRAGPLSPPIRQYRNHAADRRRVFRRDAGHPARRGASSNSSARTSPTSMSRRSTRRSRSSAQNVAPLALLAPPEACHGQSSSVRQHRPASAFSTTTSAATFVGGQVVMTAGVDALPLDTKARVLLAVQSLRRIHRGQRPAPRARLRQLRDRRRNLLLQDRLLLPRHGRRFGRSRRSREDDARAHHHARRRVLTPAPTERRPAMATATSLSCLHRRQTRRPRRLLARHRCGVHAPGWRRLQCRPASAADRRQDRAAAAKDDQPSSRPQDANVSTIKPGSRRR